MKTGKPRRAMALGNTAMIVLSADADSVPIGRGFRASVNGLLVDGTPTMAQCEKVGMLLRVIERCAPFAIGDYIVYVEDRFGEESSQIISDDSGWSLSTIAVYKWIAGRIPIDRRRMDRLGIRHHLLVAGLTPAQQSKWLEKAAADDEQEPWTVKRLADAIRENEDLQPTAFFVVVTVQTIAKQAELIARLEAEGLTCKATVSRKAKAVQ